mmetsp:Transcript_119035/g.265694  ORF Transcript_119035/g.265694 Transcript_119035/m.265694 type:complete len:406 (+) Transcript_119035:55-1272(+)
MAMGSSWLLCLLGGIAAAYVLPQLLSAALFYHGRIVAWTTFFFEHPGHLMVFLRSAAYVFFIREEPSDEYQEFIDHYAVHEYSHDSITYWKFGPDPRVRPLPELLARFDWFSQESCPGCPFGDGRLPEIRKVEDPQTVHITYYDESSLDWLIEAAKKWENRTPNRILVLASGDELLSGMESEEFGNVSAVVSHLRKYFSRIWIRAKDIEVDGVKAMPALLMEEYLRDGVAATAEAAIASASIHAGSKPQHVLAAWSFHFKHLDDIEVPFKRGGLRGDAVQWAASASARRLGIDVKTVGKLEWWAELAKYRFVLVPPGQGVQSSKMFEALLVLTVPIVQRVRGGAVDDLINFGFPLVAIDAWDEITPARLDEWWRTLSPRLASFRSNCFNTDAMWRLITGKIDRCS